MNLQKIATAVVAAFVSASTVAPLPQAAAQQRGARPAGLQQSGSQPAGHQQAGLQQAGLQPAGLQKAGLQPAGVQPAPQPVARATNSPTLRTLRLPPERLTDVANALGLKYGYSPDVAVSADVARGELLIMAPPQMQVQMEGEIQQILSSGVAQRNGRTVSTATTSRQFSLQRISWREFEGTLQEVGGGGLPITTRRNGELASFEFVDQPIGRATVEVDRRENSVTVVAPEPVMNGWKTIIQALDQGAQDPGDVLEMVRMENAEPAPIQRAIRLLQQLKIADLPAGSGATVGVAGSATRFMTAGLAPQDAQRTDAQRADAQEAAGGAAQEAATPQGNAAAANAAAAAANAAAAAADAAEIAAGGEGGGLFGDVQIQFVPELGIIIVRGAKRDVQRVMDVIEEIEQQSVITQPEIEVYPLQHVDSEAVASLVEQLYADMLGSRGAPLSVTALVRPNALLLVGRREAITSVKELLQQLDQPSEPSASLRVFRLEHASATDAEQTIRDFFTARPGSDEELRPVLGTRVRVVADFRTNSLIVQAAPRDLQEVGKMIAELDVSTVPAQDEVRVFPLKNALADELQPILQEAISGASEDSDGENFTRPSTTLSIRAVAENGTQLIDSGLLAGVVVTADPNANALVVRAPSISMALIAELIRQLDQLPGAESVVKVFQLQNSDAAALTQALTDLFGAGQGQGAGGGGAPINLAQASAGNDGSLVQLRFATDVRTNSVIAAGSIGDLEVVESMLLRLDTEGFASRITEVIWLKNANAESVAVAIQEYVQQRRQGVLQIQQAQQGGLSAYDAVERDLVAVPEIVSNSLLISVSPRLYDTVRRVIDQLDRRPPMVMVKVLLAEVSLSDGFEFGTEFGTQDSLLFDRGVALAGSPASDPGFNFNNVGLPNENQLDAGELASQTLSTFGLGRSSSQFGYGGFVFAAASDSISLLLRTLQDAQRLQILSRPMIVTRDNTEALVQVGQTVPRVSGVQPSTGLIAPTVIIEDIDVGLILRVLPRVGADGLIRMDIDAERSAVGPISQGIPVGFGADGNVILSPRIDRTRAQSTLTAFSGQTVVYGGLIQKNRSQSSRRVPYISDIPLIGMLFRYDQEIETRSELLVVMTPMIINGDEDLEYIKATESSRMSYCIADVVEMHGDVGLSGGYGLWGPAVGPMIYPDLTPTIDDIHLHHMQQEMASGAPLAPQFVPPGTEATVPAPMPPAPYETAPYETAPGYYPPGSDPGLDGPYVPPVTPARPPLGIGPAAGMPSVVEPAYPVTPMNHIQQAQHLAPNAAATRAVAPNQAAPNQAAPNQAAPSTFRPQRMPSIR